VSKALWSEQDPVEEERENGIVIRRRASCHISADDVAAPERKATVAYAGETWSVETVRNVGDGSLHELMLLIAEAAEAAPAYRM
jgi:hypothetical protein